MEVVMIRVRTSAVALLVSAISVTACGGSEKKAEAPSRQTYAPAPGANPAPAARPGDVGAPVECTSADIERLTRERDSARQWASEEQRRQETEMRMRGQRSELETKAWQQLDDVDEDIRMLRRRLDNWTTTRDRKAAYSMLSDIETKRALVNDEVRRIRSEPEHSFPKLKVDVQVDLDELTEMVKRALAP
jgi:hypothetical protein